MSDLLSRIARLKEIPFEKAFSAIAAVCVLELGDLPTWICCPVHSEKTPSLKVEETYWYCHGACKTGGDALDFLVAYEGLALSDAVARLEGILGISENAAEAAAARARAAKPVVSSERELDAWQGAIDELVRPFFDRVCPYLRSPDPVIAGIAEGRADHVFEELQCVATGGPPRVSRARREKLRELRYWATEIQAGIERDVLRATGRDRFDVAMLARGPTVTRLRATADYLRPLRDALRDLAREKRQRLSRRRSSP